MPSGAVLIRSTCASTLVSLPLRRSPGSTLAASSGRRRPGSAVLGPYGLPVVFDLDYQIVVILIECVDCTGPTKGLAFVDDQRRCLTPLAKEVAHLRDRRSANCVLRPTGATVSSTTMVNDGSLKRTGSASAGAERRLAGGLALMLTCPQMLHTWRCRSAPTLWITYS